MSSARPHLFLRYLRQRLPVREIAARVGVHRSTVYRWLVGATPNPTNQATLKEAARAELAAATAHIPVTFTKARLGGGWKVWGPAARLRRGAQVTVTKKSGEQVTVTVTGVLRDSGRREGGVLMVAASFVDTAAVGWCRCGCGDRLTHFDRTASAVPGYKFDCA